MLGLDWLSNFNPQLPDGTLQKLIAQGLNDPNLVAHAEQATLMSTLGITLGEAVRLQLHAKNNIAGASATPTFAAPMSNPAGAAPTATAPVMPTITAPSGPIPIPIVVATPTRADEIRNALNNLALGNLDVIPDLLDLGMTHVVVNANNLPDPEATSKWRASGSPLDTKYWQNKPIVDIRTVGLQLFKNPRTLRALQDGVDGDTGIAWGALGVTGLTTARGIFAMKMDGHASDQDIFDDVRTNGTRSQNVRQRFENEPTLELQFRNEVNPRGAAPTPHGTPGNGGLRGSPLRDGSGRRPGGFMDPTHGTGGRHSSELQALITQCYSHDQLYQVASSLGVAVNINDSVSEMSQGLFNHLNTSGYLRPGSESGSIFFAKLRQDAPHLQSEIQRMRTLLGI